VDGTRIKWHREAEREPGLRDIFSRMLEYRRHVLAIFDTLVGWGRPAAARSVNRKPSPTGFVRGRSSHLNSLYDRSGQNPSGNPIRHSAF